MLSNFLEWWNQPFKGREMDALGWFLFLGLLIIIMGLWAVILNHVKGGNS